MSKPTWKKTCGCSSTSAFCVWPVQQPRFRKDDSPLARAIWRSPTRILGARFIVVCHFGKPSARALGEGLSPRSPRLRFGLVNDAAMLRSCRMLAAETPVAETPSPASAHETD